MERKIGEIFEYNGEWYQAVDNTNSIMCSGCTFVNGYNECEADISVVGNCGCKDGNPLIFKKLKKVGDPYTTSVDKTVQNYLLETAVSVPPKDVFTLINNEQRLIAIEIKQTKEDMEEKKIQLKREDIDYLTRKIRYLVYKTNDYDRATEEIMNLFIPSDTEHSSSEKIGKNLKPFDLKAAKAGKPVCTRDGRKARIICFDAKGDKPIIALVEMGTAETPNNYPIDGKAVSAKEASCDLMMLPEKKEGWVNVYKGNMYDTESEAKKAHVENGYIDTIKIEWEE